VVQMLHKILSSVGPTDTFPFPYFLWFDYVHLCSNVNISIGTHFKPKF
jgi:hypothetical protein